MSHGHEMRDRQYPVEEDIGLQRRIWRFERVGWYALIAIVALTLCGLFSHGWLSTVSVTSQRQDLVVEYERFHRSGGVNSMVIHSRGAPGMPHVLVIGSAMLEGFSVDSMQPQPIASAGTRQGLRLTLMGDAQGESALYLAWRSEGLGLVNSQIGIEGGGSVSLTQFIYP